MREDKLLSSLMPSHPDLLPVIQDIRAKYNIPEIGPEDDGLTENLLSDEALDWEEIRADICSRIREIPDLFPVDLLNRFLAYENRTHEIKFR